MYKVNAFGCPETPDDWNAAAVEAAERLSAHRFPTHQGAIPWWRPGVFVAFGNCGYADAEDGPASITILRQKLDDEDLVELGFGTSSDGYSWAMLVGPSSMSAEHPPEAQQTSLTFDDMATALRLASFVTEAVRIARGIGFDGSDEHWEMYKAMQGLIEPGDLPGPGDILHEPDEEDDDGNGEATQEWTHDEDD